MADKRLSYGKIVGKQVRMCEGIHNGEIGICEYWDNIEKTFGVSLESCENKFNPDGICTCDRDSFEIL